MQDEKEQLDQATSERLNQLASMPMDMSRLEEKMLDQLPPRPTTARVTADRVASSWLRVAALIFLLIGIGGATYFAFFGVSPQQAVAQTMTVAELHDYLLEDAQSEYRAATILQAQEIVDAQVEGRLSLPTINGTHVESCCLVEGEFPLRAALVVEHANGMATIVIAQGKDFAYQMESIDHPSGINLMGHDHAGMPMVMRNIGDLWMCVMGDLSEEDLADVAAQIVF